jgi:hypothetical protein
MRYAARVLAGIVAVALPFCFLGTGTGCGGGSGGSGGGGDAETLITKNSCQLCHSPNNTPTDLSGSTKDLQPVYGKHSFGRNLTPDKATGLGTWTTAQIKAAITSGKRNDGSLLCTVMPLFATPCNANEQTCYPPISDADLNTIVEYLQGLKPVSHEIPKSPCN